MKSLRFHILTLLALLSQTLLAQPLRIAPENGGLDSLNRLPEVTITAQQTQRQIIPVQNLSGEELKRLSVQGVADALRYFSGVQIKDYGGIGGLKSVNVRSLGTNHTGVFYDGVELGNAQNGVVDLGRFSLDNMEQLTLYNGQKSNILQTAKDYASASAVYLQTRMPQFEDGKHDHLKLAIKAGSFSTINPSLLWEHQLSERTSFQLSTEFMYTSGRYKFHYAKKNGYDTTEVRKNGDVRALRVEAGLFRKTDKKEWRVKAYFYNSGRGYPGAAVREEPGKFRHQDRQWDSNVFLQGSLRRQYGTAYSLLLNAKVSYDYLHYLSDPRLDVTTMYTDNHYRQAEGYLSAAHLFSLFPWWNLSLSNDVQINYLDADLVDFVYPTRLTLLSALSTSMHFDKLSLQASLLHTYASDHTEKAGGSAGKKSKLTPTLVLSYNPVQPLAIRAFYKRIFRLPTFNDLYYTFIGNKNLKPEYTTQYDLGATWTLNLSSGKWLRSLEMQADGYYNEVEDKIVAMPTSNQFRWTMMNFGLCHIWGLDASVKAFWQLGKVDLTTHATYTYNKAMDCTEPESAFYGGQLPYIPWHSFSAIVSGSWKNWTANYSFIYTGKRYESSANIPENYSKPWYTSDLSLSRTFPLRAATWRLTFEANNIFNQQYEVVQCYPMPGINFKIKINIEI